jgi:type IV secretion system protein TrbL
MDKIPQSFSQLANSATGVNIQPDTILEQAFLMVNAIWDGLSMWSPGDSMGLILAGIIILIAFALMAANLFIVIIKLYALIAGAYMVYSLGGLSYTRSYAINPIIAIIKAGLELFFIKLFLGLSVSTIQNMAANVGTDNNSIMAMIAVAVLLASLVQMVGGMVESLLAGHLGGNSTSGLGMAKATFAAAGGAAVGAVAGSIAGNSAINAAKELSSAGQGSTLGNLAKAASTDAVNTITGANKYAAGNMGVRMANTMMSQAETLNNSKDLASSTSSATSGNDNKSTSSKVFGAANDLMGAIKQAKDSTSSSDTSSNSEYISGVNDQNFNKGQ